MSLSALILAGCADVKGEQKYPTRRAGDEDLVYAGEREGLFGKGGLGLFGSDKKTESTAGITVNAYLWRAALDTVSFMPIANADPFGGTIITDWYEAPEANGERIKANVLILSRSLRTDALKVTLFRQVKRPQRPVGRRQGRPENRFAIRGSHPDPRRAMRVAAKEAQ
jgi:hypothetical protein